jgi:hypothetical protein
MDRKSMKGDAPIIMAAIIGVLFIIISIIIGLNAWERVIYTECWKDAAEQLDQLCLGGGIFECTSPGVSSEIEHTVKLGGCVKAVYIVNRENIATALLDAGYGDSAECEWSLKSFIVVIPRKLGVFESGEIAEHPVDYVRQEASNIICRGYNTVLQDSNMKLLGPSDKNEIVEYCLTVRRLPGVGDDDYIFKVEARESACDKT